jgi:hypothetical protein
MVAADGSIWAGTAYGGLARLSFPENIPEAFRPTFNLYPNPCEGEVFCDRQGIGGPGRWQVLDPSGRIVREGGLGRGAVSRIPLEGLAPACYTFVVTDQYTRATRILQILP